MSLRPGTDSAVIAAISAPSITTAYLIRLDFKSETVCVWTGIGSVTAMMSADTLLNGQTFDEISHGVVTQIGDNSFSMTGSETFQMSLAIPSSPSTAIAAAQVFPSEYQARQATVWRALLIRPADPLAEPLWMYRRIRSGAMDKIEISNDGDSHIFLLSIESHASLISSASQSTYLDQPRFDPNDISQKWAPSLANGGKSPTDGSYNASTPLYGGSGYAQTGFRANNN